MRVFSKVFHFFECRHLLCYLMSQAFYLFLDRLHVISTFRILLIQFVSLKTKVVLIQKQRPSVSILLKPSFTQLGNGRDLLLDLGLVFHWRYCDIVHWWCFSCVVSGRHSWLSLSEQFGLSEYQQHLRLSEFSVIIIVVWDGCDLLPFRLFRGWCLTSLLSGFLVQCIGGRVWPGPWPFC